MSLERHSLLDIAEVRDIQERLLRRFAQFCEQNDLRYMLTYGTLLGAIRHHGFIPWDDDIDVMMPRSDYQRFIELSHELEAYAGGRIRYSTGIFDPYPFPYAKLFDPATTLVEHYSGAAPLGVNIDVFPLDAWPTSPFTRALRRTYVRLLLESLLVLKTWTRGRPGRFPPFVYRIGQTMLSLIPIGLVIRHITKMASRAAATASDLGGVVVGPYREVIQMTDLLPTSIGYFEGGEYRIPACPDRVLATIFGDYMTLPPPEKRITDHSFDAFNIPLDAYLKRL